MNIAMTEPKAAVSPSLKGKVSLVTGSTSGIGLGIARALAGAGSAVVLNGFGKPEEIESARQGVAKPVRPTTAAAVRPNLGYPRFRPGRCANLLTATGGGS